MNRSFIHGFQVYVSRNNVNVKQCEIISFIVWIADIGQVSVNITLIIALIINFTF